MEILFEVNCLYLRNIMNSFAEPPIIIRQDLMSRCKGYNDR